MSPGSETTVRPATIVVDRSATIHVISESYGEKGASLQIKATPGTLAALQRRLAH